MDLLAFILSALVLSFLALLFWSRARRLSLLPLGTVPQRVASVFAALALLCAGFADRTYHQHLPSTVVTATIAEIHPHRHKYGFTDDTGTLKIRPPDGDVLSLATTGNLYQLKAGQTVRIGYDHVALLIRTIDILDPSGRTRTHIDNQPTNRSRLGPWFFAAFFVAATAFPSRRKYPPVRHKQLVPYEPQHGEDS